jgi:hypothetical protein
VEGGLGVAQPALVVVPSVLRPAAAVVVDVPACYLV